MTTPDPVMPGVGNGGPGLAAFQAEVARLFFGLPESRGFLLAGGAALLAQHLTARPTEDLDFFTAPERGQVPAARDALQEAAGRQGWGAERIHDSDTFCRLVLRGGRGTALVDLSVNAPPDLPPSVTEAGPTLAPEELAGHKLLALFDRAAARRPLNFGSSTPLGNPSCQHKPRPSRERSGSTAP